VMDLVHGFSPDWLRIFSARGLARIHGDTRA
jgi:hypothetical protein